MAKCSLCPQTFDDDDEFLHDRKVIHENYHLVKMGKIRHHNGKVNLTRRNIVIGKVKWI